MTATTGIVRITATVSFGDPVDEEEAIQTLGEAVLDEGAEFTFEHGASGGSNDPITLADREDDRVWVVVSFLSDGSPTLDVFADTEEGEAEAKAVVARITADNRECTLHKNVVNR